LCGTPISLAGSLHRCGIAGFIAIAGFADPHADVQVSMRIRQGSANGQIMRGRRGHPQLRVLGFFGQLPYSLSGQRTLEIAGGFARNGEAVTNLDFGPMGTIVHHPAPYALGQVVAHARDQHQLGAGDGPFDNANHSLTCR
jgi:hypothetical protein